MEWFYRVPGVQALQGADAFFAFFEVPYDADQLSRCQVPVLREFRRRLMAAVPLRNALDDTPNADWQLARRLLAESYQQWVGGGRDDAEI
ncbi:nitrogenase-stabilizing/protective protein NifW [Dickeya solani]|uniref:Nitrogenase-stabilizing/protective protein NifW n=1 Tax=Dickeya solani TaxID=1089444 RepID=A0ABU4EIA5_9GAMM|nr:nitrogenase-stabilizing/protective protein NifW [Dickeya solani]MCA7000496.1 nitrogenase-stabilizing/protective protein NifW [Dickeya solani]MCZ0821192.1 nitrogen fixation protein NifW [Dickeya solani]MDV6995078.1 nitrogenase-stabilizing/protective protein NifW [Dickeya solani]MDV7004551.1 nitrogenase-stabilizing/protective protein NifW [Dickeya solani]MDV7037662.1 nitrogenase-stabilizing/protective protein NifW [Dickeya solani]